MPETEPAVEREPQVSDVVAAFKYVIAEMSPVIGPEELADLVSEIENAEDIEDAMGAAAGAFAVSGLDDEEGLERMGKILQVEAIISNGNTTQSPTE